MRLLLVILAIMHSILLYRFDKMARRVEHLEIQQYCLLTDCVNKDRNKIMEHNT